MLELDLLKHESGHLFHCTIALRDAEDEYEIRLSREEALAVVARSSVDFEEALSLLRQELEEQGLLLLCNRYRRDAFVSSMARQMSDGLACYLIEPGVPVDPDRLVESLAPAPVDAVVFAEEARDYIHQWIESFD